MPKVSICIPTYNQTVYLRKTLQSVLDQDFTDYELIVTDDSTHDAVEQLLKEFDFKGRLQYYHNSPSLGSPANWNYGISKAIGEYIKIMHHDDWFTSKDSLAIFVEAIEKTGTSFVFSDAAVVHINSNISGSHLLDAEIIQVLRDNPQVLFLGNFVGSPSVTMYRRDADVVFDEHLKWLVDVDFYIRYLTRHPNVYHINKQLVSIITDADHTLTKVCYNNKDIEIGENLYLFNKLSPFLSLKKKVHYAKFLLRFLVRFNTLSISAIRNCGYSGELPVVFRLVLFFKRSKMLFS